MDHISPDSHPAPQEFTSVSAPVGHKGCREASEGVTIKCTKASWLSLVIVALSDAIVEAPPPSQTLNGTSPLAFGQA